MGFNSAFKGLNVTQKIQKRDIEYNTAMKRDWMLEEITQMYVSGLPKGRGFDSRWCHWYMLLK